MKMFSDSRLVVGQIKGELSQARLLQSGFDSFSLHQISRSRNTHVDSLSTLATSLVQSLPWVILIEDLCNPTKMKREKVQIHQFRVEPSWMDPIVLFLRMTSWPKRRGKLTKCKERLPDFGCPRIKSCTSTLFLSHICYASILKQWSHS